MIILSIINVRKKENEVKVFKLDYTKLGAIELKVLIKDASKFLVEELEQIILDQENLLNNFEIFNFETLKRQILI